MVRARLFRAFLVLTWAALGCAASPADTPTAADSAVTETDTGFLDTSGDVPGEADATTSAPREVLFVGNSYVYVGDLLGQVKSLGTSARTVVNTDSVAVGSASLKTHYETTGALARIREAKWTHVVLQGQSVEPLTDASGFDFYAKKLADEVKLAGAKVVFYETWARRAGDPVYSESWSGGDPKTMQARLRAAYEKVAATNDALLARVGDAREVALTKTFGFTLFAADGSHPSVEGAYLGACVFFKVLTTRPSLGLSSKPPALAGAEAAELQSIADGVTP